MLQINNEAEVKIWQFWIHGPQWRPQWNPRGNDVNTPDAAMAVIRHLMKQFGVDPAMLEDDDSGLSLSVLESQWYGNMLT